MKGKRLIEYTDFNCLLANACLNRRQLQNRGKHGRHGPVVGKRLIIENQILRRPFSIAWSTNR